MSYTNCFLEWEIYDPFLPGRDLEAVFYQGYPTTTQWRATVRPLNKATDYWEFSFSLEFDTRFDSRQEIVVSILMVRILVNGAEIEMKHIDDRRFNADNQFRYDLQSRAPISNQTEPRCLYIVIVIALPDEGRICEYICLPFHGEEDLRCLSRNLGLLLSSPQYSNMMLMPNNSQEHIRVHSYIIGARWNNFFALHDIEAGIRSIVETNMTRSVLRDILTYMYSGTVGLTWPDWIDPAYTTELFEVIDLYKLYHLYSVFINTNSIQHRETKNSGVFASYLYHLQLSDDRKLIDTLYNGVRIGSEYGLVLEVLVTRIFDMHSDPNQGIPWLRYTLQSVSSSKLYVKVSLELIIEAFGEQLPPNSFHERDFVIDPFAKVESGSELALGRLDNITQTEFAALRYFTRCFLNVTDGTTVEQIGNKNGVAERNESAMLDVLSNHMYELRSQPVNEDGMRVLCLTEDLPGEGAPCFEDVHKAIFAVRVPAWWQGLENAAPSSNLPDDYMTPTLSQDSLLFVLNYMYAGKVYTNPFLSPLDEVKEFARRTGFFSLLNFADGIACFL